VQRMLELREQGYATAALTETSTAAPGVS